VRWKEKVYENEVVTKSGTRKLIYWNNALIKDEVGQIKVLCSGIDITERKHSEEALIKSRMSFICCRINATYGLHFRRTEYLFKSTMG
jgi:hypothetical protein